MKKTAFELIADEQSRKANKYGYSTDHINKTPEDYGSGELALAAASYCAPQLANDIFPWDLSYFKPSPQDRIKELVKAGSMIVDEINRLQA